MLKSISVLSIFNDFNEPIGYLAKEMQRKIFGICMISQLNAHQFLTLEKLIEATKDMAIDQSILITCTQALES